MPEEHSETHGAGAGAGAGEHDVSREEAIRQRAYEISESDPGSSPEENWERAERELGGADER